MREKIRKEKENIDNEVMSLHLYRIDRGLTEEEQKKLYKLENYLEALNNELMKNLNQ